jgi:hypothetical protein
MHFKRRKTEVALQLHGCQEVRRGITIVSREHDVGDFALSILHPLSLSPPSDPLLLKGLNI